MPAQTDTASEEWHRVVFRAPPELDAWLEDTAALSGLAVAALCRLILIATMRGERRAGRDPQDAS